MTLSSSRYLPGFSVYFFVQTIYTNYERKITSKLLVTSPFSINFRSQIENLVSDYRLPGASSVRIAGKTGLY
jgi:hypothetical protein